MYNIWGDILKFKTIILITVLITILTIGAVSASDDLDNVTSSDEDILTLDDSDYLNGDDDDDVDDENETSYTEVIINIPDEVEIGSNDEVEVYLPDDAVGIVKIFNDNTILYNVNVDGDEDNEVSFSLDDLGCGYFLIKAEFTPTNGKYSTVTNQSWVNITYNITINADEEYIFAKTDNLIYVSAPPEILSQVIVKINNVQYALINMPDTLSMGYINISSFKIGVYKIEASFAGNDKYEAYTTNDTVYVITSIDTLDNEVEYNSDAYISLTLPTNSTGMLVLYINDTYVDEAYFVNGVSKIKFPTSKIGQYYYDVLFRGNDFNITSVENKFVTVLPKITAPEVMTVGEDKYLTIEYNSDAQAFFTIEADGEYITTLTSPGSISLKDLDDGEASIEVLFTYNGFNYILNKDIIINPVPFRFVGVKNINMVYGDGTTYPITLYGTNGKLLEEDDAIEIKIGKKTYDAFTNSKGAVNFKIPNTVLPGKYSVVLIYDDGDNLFKAYSNLVVKQSLILKKTKVKASAKSIVLTASLKNMNKKLLKNKRIIFKFNGKKFTAKTNAKGVAKVTIKQNILKKLKVGKKVKYQATFLKNTVVKVVKVKK